MPSDRELEVLELCAQGLTFDEAAAALWVSRDTVKSHVQNLREKLGARNLAHAVHLAWQQGLLPRSGG